MLFSTNSFLTEVFTAVLSISVSETDIYFPNSIAHTSYYNI